MARSTNRFLLLLALILFTPVANVVGQGKPVEKDMPLVGTVWSLVQVDGLSIPDGSVRSAFALRRGDVAATDDSGNQLTGFYDTDGDSLHVHLVTTTLLARLPSKFPTSERTGPSQSQLFVAALAATSQFNIHGSTLELLNSKGRMVARFHGSIKQN